MTYLYMCRLELAVARILNIQPVGEVVLRQRDGQVFVASGRELGCRVVGAFRAFHVEISVHHVRGDAPADKVEEPLALHRALQSRLEAQGLAGVVLRPALGRVFADEVVGGVLLRVLEVLHVLALHRAAADAVNDGPRFLQPGGVAQLDEGLSLPQQDVRVADDLPVQARRAPRPAVVHVRALRRDEETLRAVVAVVALIAHPEVLARRVGVRLPSDVRPSYDEVQARVHRAVHLRIHRVALGVERDDIVVAVVERVEQREAVGVRLVRVNQVLAGQEEAVAAVWALRRVQQVAPVHATGIVRPVVHGELNGKDGFLAVLVGDEVQLLEVVQQVVVPLEASAQVYYFAEQRAVDVRHAVRLLVLLVSLIELHLRGVRPGDVPVDAANLRLRLGQDIGGVHQLFGNHAEDFVAGVLVVRNVVVLVNLHVLVEVRDAVEQAAQFEVEVRSQHPHLSLAHLYLRQILSGDVVQCLQGRVATLHAAVQLEPLAIHVAHGGVYVERLHAVHLFDVGHAAAPFVRVVAAHRTEAPVGHRDKPYAVVLRGYSAQPGVGGRNKQVYALGRGQVLVVQSRLGLDIQETALVAARRQGRQADCERNISQFHTYKSVNG